MALNINLKKEASFNFAESESYLRKQQDIDTLIVLSKVLELNVTSEISDKVISKINTLLDRV